MKTDMTLLEKNGAPTIVELKAFFRNHDFSTQVSGYDPTNASIEDNNVYYKVKKHFLASWNEQMKVLTGKGSLVNFTSNFPVRCLEEANEELVAGTVMEVLSDAALCELILDSVFERFEDDIITEVKRYAETHNKSAEELIEAEFANVFDRFSNRFLGTMTNILQRVEDVPEILEISKKISTHEDFAKTKTKNYDKIDFDRQWNHTRTKTGAMESLNQMKEYEHNESESAAEFVYDDPQTHLNMIETIKSFYAFLGDDTDIKIFKLKADGYTQKQIADHFGFKTHSAVGKRLKKIEEKRQEFLALKL